MRYSAVLAVMATPAMAHHEAAIASALPALLPWIIGASAGGLALWRNLRQLRRRE